MATRRDRRKEPNTVIEDVDASPKNSAPAPKLAASKPIEASAVQPLARPERVPIHVFCIHKTNGKIDQAAGFLAFAKGQRWRQKSWAEWNEAWDAFQAREVR